ncbi:MAG: hypothetical protein ACXWUG_18980 [Polyangiales bacterium]
MLRFARLALIASLLFVGCSPSEPPKPPPHEPTEAEAQAELEAAKQKDGIALIEVFNKYPKLESGKKALRLGVRKMLEKAIESAEACNESAASGALAHVAPYTTDDPSIDEAYDETKTTIGKEHQRCQLERLDADVKKSEAEWDWPKVFSRISSEKEAEGGALKKRRIDATDRWRTWLDKTLEQVIAKKSFAAVMGDKREQFDDAVDPEQLPPELAPEIEKRAGAIKGLEVVFDKLEGGQLLDPPVKYWTFGAPKARKPDLTEGAILPQGIEFFAVAKGKSKGLTLLVVGAEKGDLYTRLASIKLLIPESDARTYDTRATLPENLVGARVLAPIAAGSDTLAVATVLTEKGDVVVVQPLGKKASKVGAKKKELRGLLLSPGQKVTVMVGVMAKPGEIADVPEEERVLVKVSGFESYFPIGDVRVKRGDLPPMPE